MQMLNRVEQLARVGHWGKRPVEIGRAGAALPKFAPAALRFELRRQHAEQRCGAGVEIGEHAVSVEKQAWLCRGHQKRAGSSSTRTGASSRCQPEWRSKSLLSRARRPVPSDQVM